jgi:hypothetical protein
MPLNKQDFQELTHLPGFLADPPPKKSARGRGQDRLVLYLRMEGDADISPEKTSELLKELHTAYYAKKGTVTSALKEVVDETNNVILTHNHRLANTGKQVVGHLFGMVYKGENLYFIQSGESHGFVLLDNDIDYLNDPDSAGPGLGINRSPSMKFFQKSINDKIKILIINSIPEGWNAGTLLNSSNQTLAILRRRLFADATQDFQGVLIDPVLGKGDINIIRSVSDLESISKQDFQPIPEPAVLKEKTTPLALESEPPLDNYSYEKINSSDAPADVDQVDNYRKLLASFIEKFKILKIDMPQLKVPTLKGISVFLGKTFTWIRVFSNRIVPNDFAIKLPSSIMAIIAIAVPLVISAIAASIFFNQGANQQYQLYINQANIAHELAISQSDPSSLLDSWNDVVENVEKAERYRETDESEALGNKAHATIDYLEEITRIEYDAIILGTMAESVNITQIVVSGKDIYMLDSNSGEVIRALFTGAKYEIDSSFICEPHVFGNVIVGTLIDIAPLPKPNVNNASVLAMDETGNLMYCIPEAPPLVVSLPVPDSLWGKPNSITLENNNLYILDPLSNAVWFYEGADFQFQNSPNFFFVDNVPNLSGAIDIAVNKDDLYVLYQDGHTIKCAYSKLVEAPTDCIDPILYQDDRSGKVSSEIFPDATFYQLAHSQPPEPSLYYLDPVEGTVYHFTLQLNLVNQFRPQNDLEGDFFSAMTIVDNQAVFMAKGNEVYLGYIP